MELKELHDLPPAVEISQGSTCIDHYLSVSSLGLSDYTILSIGIRVHLCLRKLPSRCAGSEENVDLLKRTALLQVPMYQHWVSVSS